MQHNLQKNIVLLIIVIPKGVIMKTITLKTDEKLFEEITNLSRKLKLSKSELIRRAIKEYEKKIALQNIKRQIQQASLNIRKESANMIEDLENTIDDGLENV